MEKTIKFGDTEIRLNNRVGWVLTYRDQFGTDILPTIMPLFAGLLDIVSGVIAQNDGDDISLENVLRLIDTDSVMDALVHLSGFELAEFLNITWAMAKEADEDIPEPEKWLRGFDEFPLDIVVPEVFKLAFNGMVSSKNRDRLKSLTQPKKSE